jgi:hypothetical protein
MKSLSQVFNEAKLADNVTPEQFVVTISDKFKTNPGYNIRRQGITERPNMIITKNNGIYGNELIDIEYNTDAVEKYLIVIQSKITLTAQSLANTKANYCTTSTMDVKTKSIKTKKYFSSLADVLRTIDNYFKNFA